MTHHLKTWPEYFDAVRQGVKTFEARKNDRNFQVGDVLILDEWDPVSEAYTGCHWHCDVTYVLPGGQFGIEPGYCVLGLDGRR